jgi:hypothetical protein
MKFCKRCKKKKPISSFYLNGYRRKNGTSGNRTDCKVCCNKISNDYRDANKKRINSQRKRNYQKDKTKAIESNLKRYYGIDLIVYDQIFKNQKGRCKICFLHQLKFERRFDVDHNHKTGKIRGLLCIRCNRGIGLLKDNIKILKRAIRYLQQG